MQFTKFTSEPRVMQGRWFAKPSRAAAFAYHPDGQLARADYGNGKTEEFLWDGLALIKRGDEQFVNEPHIGGGAPVFSSSGTAYFNDILGTTLGVKTKGRKYAAAAQTAFGEGDAAFFTGKPQVSGLGRAFLFRNYRPDLAKWQTADQLGYPDGWNQLAYCGNGVIGAVDWLGGCAICVGCSSKCSCCTPYYYWPEWFHENSEDKKNLYCLGKDGFPVLNPRLWAGQIRIEDNRC